MLGSNWAEFVCLLSASGLLSNDEETDRSNNSNSVKSLFSM